MLLARFFARQTVGGRLIPFAVAGLLVMIAVAGSQATLARVGLFFIAFALPHAALALSVMESDGRFDQVRLAGVPPGALCRAALAGLAGPWVALGVVALAVSRLAIPGFPETASAAVLLVAAACAMSAAGFAVPRLGTLADPRISLIGLSALIYGVVLVVGPPLESVLRVLPGINISRAAAYTWLLVLMAVVIAASLPRVIQRFARPLVSRPNVAGAGVRLANAIRRSVGPVAGRGVLLTFRPALALGATAVAALVLLLVTEQGRSWASPLPYVPIFVGMLAVSLTTRADVDSGRLEVICLSAAGGARTIASHVAGLWLPFIVASLGVGVMSWIATGQRPIGVGPVLATLAVVSPLSVAEGWHRRMVLVYSLPFAAVVMLLLARLQYSPLRLDAGEAMFWRGTSCTLLALAAGITWHVAAHALGRPEHTVLRGWTGVAAVAILTAVALLPRIAESVGVNRVPEYALLCLALIVAGSWLTAPFGSRLSTLDRWGPVAGTAIVSGGLVAVSHQRYAIDIVSLAILPAGILWATMRIHERLGTKAGWSIALRVALAYTLMQWPILGIFPPAALAPLQAWLTAGASAVPGSSAGQASLAFVVGAAGALAFAVILEIGLRLAPAMRHQLRSISTRSTR